MNKNIMNKLIAFILCFAMIFAPIMQSANIFAQNTTDNVIAISPSSSVTVTKEKNSLLTARAEKHGDFQWQYFAKEQNMWVNIYGETQNKCNLTYAKVFNMLDDNNETKVRCMIKTNGETFGSDTVKVVVDKTTPKKKSVAKDSQKPVIVKKQKVENELKTTPNVNNQSDDITDVGDIANTENGSNDVINDSENVYSTENDSENTTNESEHKTYNVVINYVFENNEIVADPYTANLAAGSNFNANVTFPVVQGYLPYVNNNRQDSIDLNYTNIQQDETITVVYKPTNVNYTVIHYKQNLNNDQYTESERETKQGLTNSTVPKIEKSYDGFYALLYERPTIAADGSTVVEVYYDRYYYLMNFDLDGGYGVEPIYARYGTSIGNVGTPTKAGYTFKGWSLDGKNIVNLPANMPAENKTYKAVWEANATAKVTVVFWGENADDEEYSYIKSSEVKVKPGTEFTYLICGKEAHEHSESCYTCGQESHTTHTTSCYSGVGNKKGIFVGVGFPDNPQNGQVHKSRVYGNLIYINGTWYEYSGATSDGQIAPTICHTHTDICLGCGKKEHIHSSSCYISDAGLDPELWKCIKSDTVTVAADGSSVVNVYYDRTEKKLTFNYKYNTSNSNYEKTETITAKWGQNIAEQYKVIANNAGSTFWAAQDSSDGPYTNYFGIMPETNATYYNRGKSGSEGTMTYYGEDLNGDYKELFSVGGVGGYTVTDEDRYEFEGFTYHHGTSKGSSCEGAAFYYTRNSYTLTFNDGYNDVKTESVKYEAGLSTYNGYTPNVPSAYEPGSVEFGDWYLNPECTGEKYDLSAHKMPANNLILYAKWVPVTRTVEFYLDKDAYDAGTKLSTHPDVKVPHGSKVDPVPSEPEKGSYTFVGWFYMDGDKEKAFDFANMPIRKNMKVYGKWSSNTLKDYFVYYKIQGTDMQIAAPTTGSSLAGSTKTFEAKGAEELYTNYQEGYFPVVKSHSMTIDIEGNNTYTFWYVQKEAVPYTVKYLDEETGKPVATEKTVSDNRKAVVTESFVPVSGMMPDAYQKRLVVDGSEGASNEIIFYYTKDTQHAYYKITHYIQNTDGETWTEYASSEAVGDIGKAYTAEPMTINGFTYDSTVAGTVASGQLTENGLELKLYYTRNEYPYEVRYLEQGTGKQLAEPKKGSDKYGKVISESAIAINNYNCVSPSSQTLNIKIEEGTDAKINVITFYYTEKTVDINYEVVGPSGCGSVSPESEKLKVLSGEAKGSTATANEDYRFVGWYLDEACNTPVLGAQVDGTKFTPMKTQNGLSTELTYKAATYYAKFELDVTTLTIEKIVANESNTDQTFIFDVLDSENKVITTVTVKGGGKVTISDIPVGTYTVKERTDWSWRYKPDETQKTVVANASGGKVIFTNTKEKIKWLDSVTTAVNDFVSELTGN